MGVIIDFLSYILVIMLLLLSIVVIVAFGIVIIGAIVLPLLKEIIDDMRK